MGDKDGHLVRVDENGGIQDIAFGKINASLGIGADIAQAKTLKANSGLASRGVIVVGGGFIVSPEQAKKLDLGRIPGLEKHIRPYTNGNDLAKVPRNLMVIDFYGLSVENVEEKYPEAFSWIVNEVKPMREVQKRKDRRDKWWIFGWPAANLRGSIVGLERYIARPEASDRFFFSFLDAGVIPDNQLVVISSDDPYILGTLSSGIHQDWFTATAAKRQQTLRYTKTACFDTFPFPDATEAQKVRIRFLAEALDSHRVERLRLYPDLTLSGIYSVLEQIQNGGESALKEKQVKEQGALDFLLELHKSLNEAVAEAYGWPADISYEEVLSRLMELNLERAAEEDAGIIRWLRPDLQKPTAQESSLWGDGNAGVMPEIQGLSLPGF